MVLFTRSATALSLGFPLSVILMPILQSLQTSCVGIAGILVHHDRNDGLALKALFLYNASSSFLMLCNGYFVSNVSPTL